MKKQELIHLHGLLAEVSNHAEKHHGVSPDLDRYESLGVRPTSIHKSKTDHKEAVFTLADAITGSMRADQGETVPATAD